MGNEDRQSEGEWEACGNKKNLYCNNLTDTEQVHNQKEVSDLIDILAHVRLFLQQWALLAL